MENEVKNGFCLLVKLELGNIEEWYKSEAMFGPLEQSLRHVS